MFRCTLLLSQCLRYNPSSVKERILEGDKAYLVQMQLERARLRRPPQSMMSINQKFDINKFNFNKISEENEMVCELINGDRANNLTARDIMIINVSPVGRGHCLLVPQVEGCYQQVL